MRRTIKVIAKNFLPAALYQVIAAQFNILRRLTKQPKTARPHGVFVNESQTMDLRIISEPEAQPEDIAVIRNALYEFNIMATGDRNYSPLAIFLRDGGNTVRGGILGDMWAGWLHITFLWIDESLRGQGCGARLLKAAEEEAQAKGYRAIHLETFDFQARLFYERLGYIVFGELSDYPPGHTFYYLRKIL